MKNVKRIVVASDSFKGCLSSREIAQAVEQAVATCCAGVVVDGVVVADGGEGSVEALAAGCDKPVQWVWCRVDAPVRDLPQVEARYVIDHAGATAFMELAAASGLPLVPRDRRDIIHASTLGTGQMILDAVERGCRHIVLGLGGSATCDGGMGVMAALGAEFFDAEEHHLYPCAGNLGKINAINLEGIADAVSLTRFTLLADVDNPLCGPRGAARVFAPQKGASPEQVEHLEQGMLNYARFLGDAARVAGAGAAGGVAAGMVGLLPHCSIVKGAPYIIGKARLSQRVSEADLVITGEGRIDGQTAMGKAPQAVAAVARQYGVPVVAICGSVAPGVDAAALGFDSIVPVTPADMPLEVAIDKNMARQNICRAIRAMLSS